MDEIKKWVKLFSHFASTSGPAPQRRGLIKNCVCVFVCVIEGERERVCSVCVCVCVCVVYTCMCVIRLDVIVLFFYLINRIIFYIGENKILVMHLNWTFFYIGKFYFDCKYDFIVSLSIYEYKLTYVLVCLFIAITQPKPILPQKCWSMINL